MQRVDAGRRRDARGTRHRQGRVDDRERGPQVAMRDARLRPETGEVDDGHRRHLGSRAGCRRQGDDREDGSRHRAPRTDRGVHVVEQLAAVSREERAELRRVEGGAAADADESVEACARGFRRLLHGRLVRLPGDAVVDHRLDTVGTKRLLEALAEAGFRDEAIADDECPRDAELLQVLAGLRRGAGAEDDARGVERDDGGRASCHAPPAFETGARAATAPIASSIEITSPYFASMSSREPLWASIARSATPSRGTRTR